jgi:hypothetical protein
LLHSHHSFLFQLLSRNEIVRIEQHARGGGQRGGLRFGQSGFRQFLACQRRRARRLIRKATELPLDVTAQRGQLDAFSPTAEP